MWIRRRSRAGFTLLEVMLACVVMSVAVLGLMALIPETTRLTETSVEGNLSLQASHQISEAMRQYADRDFAYLWRAYNNASGDDPNGSGTAPGATFSVNGLQDAAGSSAVGAITFFTDETATVPEVGLPGDLNGDGDAVDGNVSGNYTLLPYKIAVDWKDHLGLLRHTQIFSQAAGYNPSGADDAEVDDHDGDDHDGDDDHGDDHDGDDDHGDDHDDH